MPKKKERFIRARVEKGKYKDAVLELVFKEVPPGKVMTAFDVEMLMNGKHIERYVRSIVLRIFPRDMVTVDVGLVAGGIPE